MLLCSCCCVIGQRNYIREGIALQLKAQKQSKNFVHGSIFFSNNNNKDSEICGCKLKASNYSATKDCSELF